MIHPTAIIHPKAVLDSNVQIGPYVCIDEGVELGSGCSLGPYVYITGITRIGRGNKFYSGCVIGEAPQDSKYQGTPTGLVIGEGNVFREQVTVHRSSDASKQTEIGSNCLLMTQSHVGHNTRIGNNVIVASGALLGGHSRVDDRAIISGNCLVHQFARVGTLAMMQGGAAISLDLAPYTMARGHNGICGLNIVGLRRAGISPDDRLELKALYHLLFRSEARFTERLAAARAKFSSAPAKVMIEFLEESQGAVSRERS